MALLSTIFGFLKGPVARIGDQIVEVKRAQIAAETDEAKLAADVQLADLEAKKAVLISEQGWWLTASIRPAFAWIFIIYTAKLVLWDKVLGWGSTDPLSPELANIEMLVIGAYFVGRSAEKIAARFNRS